MSIAPKEITAVILAGGFGTRIKHLLGNFPKPMAPVNGRPFIEWIVRFLAAQGIQNVIISTGHLAATVEMHFAMQPVENVRVICVPETTPLGTAGGFLNAISVVKQKPMAWLILNGDSLVATPLRDFFQSLGQPEIEGAIMGVQVRDASRFGTIAQNAQGELAGFKEKSPGAGTINAGIYLFPETTVKKFPAKSPLSFELDVFPALVGDHRRLKIIKTDAPFLDIGTPESLPKAAGFIQKNLGHLFYKPAC
ncbi:MAG: sugar phosphate nucleotidyltransferase [Verrucomicrobiota bacterium]